MTTKINPVRHMRSAGDALGALDWMLDQPGQVTQATKVAAGLTQTGVPPAEAARRAEVFVRLTCLGALVDAMQRRVAHGKVPISELRVLSSHLEVESAAAGSVLGSSFSWSDHKAGWGPESRAAFDAELDKIGPRSHFDAESWEQRDRQRSRDATPGPRAATAS
jgi:hypothetical protein